MWATSTAAKKEVADDPQATLTKDAVIDYLTKYMTKSGQGSLIQVMDHRSSRRWVRRA